MKLRRAELVWSGQEYESRVRGRDSYGNAYQRVYENVKGVSRDHMAGLHWRGVQSRIGVKSA